MESLGDFVNRKNKEHDDVKDKQEETPEPEKKDDLGDFLKKNK